MPGPPHLLLPLNGNGVVTLWMHRREGVKEGVEWCFPDGGEDCERSSYGVVELSTKVVSSRLQGLLRLLSGEWSYLGPWPVLAFHQFSRFGLIRPAFTLLNHWVNGLTPPLSEEVRAKALLRMSRGRVWSCLNRDREWPRGVFHFEDIPAALIPLAVSLCKQVQRNMERSTIISGGHILKPGLLEWEVSRGFGRVVGFVDQPVQ